MNIDIDLGVWQIVLMVLDYGIKIFAIGYVPEGRRPSSSTAWLLAILLIPFIGLPLFLLMGSPYINRRRHRIQIEATKTFDDVQAGLPDYPGPPLDAETESVIRLNRKLTGFPMVRGVNHGIHADYDETIRAIARAINDAKDYVYVEIYIQSWDETTDVFYNALARARERGVTVKLLLDQIGSFKYKGYWSLGKKLTKIGVDWRLMLPIQLHKGRFGRPDLRNHRKIIVIDGKRGFMGSQNLIKRGYDSSDRAWIDYMVELTGDIVTSMQYVFAVDWFSETNEQLPIEPHADPTEPDEPGMNLVQLLPSGPGYTTEPVLRMFSSLVHHAKKRLVLVSPYFIPDETLMEAVTTAAYRGVRVEVYVSRDVEKFMVKHAQSSYYQALLEAGVHILQFPGPYVLHSKFMLADPEIDDEHPLAIFGSANMDIRSFGLNYESTVLVSRGDLIAGFNQLAANYRAVSHELTLDEWNNRSLIRRYVDNVMRLTSSLQ